MLTTVVLVSCALLAQAEPAADADLQKQVGQLVRQLDATGLAERNKAEASLLELGPSVLEHLPADSDRQSAEVRQRLARVRKKLELVRAQDFGKARTVTLSADEMKLSAILASIEEQTGNTILDYREEFGQQTNDPSMPVDFDNVPFWQALDQLLDKADLGVYAMAQEHGVAIVNIAPGQVGRQESAAYAGAFRLEPTEMSCRRNLRYDEGHLLQLTVDISWEPRVLPIGLTYNTQDLTATDENGETLAIQGPETELVINVNPNATSAEMFLTFDAPPRGVKQIKSLKGTLTALVPGQIDTFRFDQLPSERKLEKRAAGATVTLDSVRKNNEIWEVRMRLRLDDPQNSLESHRGWVFNNEAFLEAPDGSRIDHAGFETTRQTEDEVGVAYFFDLEEGIKGHTFVYKTPSVIMSLPVEYELKDLPLP